MRELPALELDVKLHVMFFVKVNRKKSKGLIISLSVREECLFVKTFKLFTQPVIHW